MFVSTPSAQLLSKLLRVYPQCLPCKVSTPCIISRRRANKHSPAINPSFQRLSQQRQTLPRGETQREAFPKLLYSTFARAAFCRAYRCDTLSNVETSFDLLHVEKRLRILSVAFLSRKRFVDSPDASY